MALILSLAACVLAFLPAYFDHGERKRAFLRSKTRKGRWVAGIKWILINWGIPTITIIATGVHELESRITDKKTEFFRLVQLAESDNRPAFDQLKRIARDSNHPNTVIARQAVDNITRKHIGGAEPILQGMYVGGEDAHHSDNYLQVLEQQYQFLTTKPSDRHYPTNDVRHVMQAMDHGDQSNMGTRTYDAAPRMALVKHVWDLKKVSVKKRTDFLMKVVEADENLSVIEFATKRIAAHWKLRFGLLETEKFVKWWNENKNKFPDN